MPAGSSRGRRAHHLLPTSAVYERAVIDFDGLHVKQRDDFPVSESFIITYWVSCFLLVVVAALGFVGCALGVACGSGEPVAGSAGHSSCRIECQFPRSHPRQADLLDGLPDHHRCPLLLHRRSLQSHHRFDPLVVARRHVLHNDFRFAAGLAPHPGRLMPPRLACSYLLPCADRQSHPFGFAPLHLNIRPRLRLQSHIDHQRHLLPPLVMVLATFGGISPMVRLAATLIALAAATCRSPGATGVADSS